MVLLWKGESVCVHELKVKMAAAALAQAMSDRS